MKPCNEYIEQISKKSFKPMLFTTYNYIYDDGYVKELSVRDKQNYDIDDFEYMKIDISNEDIKGLKTFKTTTVNKFAEMKQIIESNKTNQLPNLFMGTVNDLGLVFVAKLKSYQI